MDIRVRQRSTTMKRTVNVLSKLNWGTRACAVLALCATTAIALPAQIATLTTIHRFCSQSGCPDGAGPYAGLVQATNGGLYGTTFVGGTNSAGTIFKITPGGTLATLYSFCPQTNCTDGAEPEAGLFQAANGDLYGTTYFGGTNGQGTVFKITQGTVFKITQGGTLTTLYSFCSQTNCTDGATPGAGLVQAANGDLYGTTYFGGTNGGTVFKITPGGTLTTLYNFCSQTNCTDGTGPLAGLVQAANGDLYGTTYFGGTNGGTVFKITPGGARKRLYLTWAKYRRRFGGGEQERMAPSRFLSEAPADLIVNLGEDDSVPQVDLHAERYQVRQSAQSNTFTGKTYNSLENISQFFADRGVAYPAQNPPGIAQRPPAPVGTPAKLPAAAPPRRSARTGMTVEHPKYGTGTVVRREGDGEDTKITVSFPRYGLKKLVEKYAGLKRG